MSYTAPAFGLPDPVTLTSASRDICAMSLPWSQSIASGTVAATRVTFVPVRLAQRHTYVKAFWANGATAAGNIEVGIYTLSGTTMTRVVASTAEAQGTVSTVQVAATFTSTTIGPGYYWLAIVSSSSTSTFWRVSMANTPGARMMGVLTSDVTLPLPTTATVIAAGQFSIPLFGFSESSAV